LNHKWSISHQLPSGLVFDKQKGIISGTPTKILSRNKYVVTASNSHGSTQTGVYIAVLPIVNNNVVFDFSRHYQWLGVILKATHTGFCCFKHVATP
jgi:hypothetical protein